jgi:flagellar basal body-associated protein FliL
MSLYKIIKLILIIIIILLFIIYYIGAISNATNTQGINKIKATATGNKFNQHKSIKPSYLNLGSAALNQTKKNVKIQVFNPKFNACKFKI